MHLSLIKSTERGSSTMWFYLSILCYNVIGMKWIGRRDSLEYTDIIHIRSTTHFYWLISGLIERFALPWSAIWSEWGKGYSIGSKLGSAGSRVGSGSPMTNLCLCGRQLPLSCWLNAWWCGWNMLIYENEIFHKIHPALWLGTVGTGYFWLITQMRIMSSWPISLYINVKSSG